jgi:small subunit ribosomal protein S13e
MPYKRTAPQWQKSSAAEVEEQCCKLAKKGMRPSAIGVTLRDSMGIPMVPSRCCFK